MRKKDHSVKMVVWMHRPTGFLQNDYTCASVHRVDCTIQYTLFHACIQRALRKKEFLIAAGYVHRVVLILCSCSLCS